MNHLIIFCVSKGLVNFSKNPLSNTQKKNEVIKSIFYRYKKVKKLDIATKK